MKARKVEWEHGVSATAIANGRLVVAAPASDSSWTGILTSYRTTKGWKSDRLRVRAGMTPVAVALGVSKNRPLLFYRDDTARGFSVDAAMYVRELTKTGDGWSTERLIYRLPSGGLNWPLTASTNDGRVHLAWAFKDDAAVESIYHLSSVDLLDWRVDRMSLGARAAGLAISPDGKSSVQLLVQSSAFDGLASIRWTPDGFSPIEELTFAKSIGPAPSLATFGADSLALTWTAIANFEYEKRTFPYPVTLVSRRARSCR